MKGTKGLLELDTQVKIFDWENRKKAKLLFRTFALPLPFHIVDPELFGQVGSGIISPDPAYNLKWPKSGG
jgi:hypothetical protein